MHTLLSEEIVNHSIVHVPEGRRLFSLVTIKDNLIEGAYNKGADKDKEHILAQIYEMLPRFKERENQTALTLSGGEQQMVAIGRGLMARPKILMLDEPPLGPAPVLLNSISETIRKIADQGTPCCWLNRMWTIHCACQTGGMSWSTAELELKSL